MLWQLLLSVAALFASSGDRRQDQAWTSDHQEHAWTSHHQIWPEQLQDEPADFAPQTRREIAIAHEALQGHHHGGDMLLTPEVQEAGIKDPKFRWPKNSAGKAEVPYVIDSALAGSRDLILRGMEQYHKLTCIKFVPRTSSNQNYVKIISGNGCYSYVGKIGGEQALSLGRGCLYVGTVVHELGHAIGLFHEHQRSDRDTYLTVYENNVISGQLHNFNRTAADQEIIFGPYDYQSIMHYGNYAFSRQPGRLQTMVAKNNTPLKEPYDKPGLDNRDIDMVNKLYNC